MHKQTAIFPDLDITTVLDQDHLLYQEETFFDHRDYSRRIMELCLKYNWWAPYQQMIAEDAIPLGWCLSFKKRDFFGKDTLNVHVIYHNHFRSEIQKKVVRGHEQTHALEFFGRLAGLENKLVNFGINAKLAEFKTDDKSEILANVGGVVSALNAGYSLSDIKNYFGEVWPKKEYEDTFSLFD